MKMNALYRSTGKEVWLCDNLTLPIDVVKDVIPEV